MVSCAQCAEIIYDWTGLPGSNFTVKNLTITSDEQGRKVWYSRDLKAEIHRCYKFATTTSQAELNRRFLAKLFSSAGLGDFHQEMEF